MKIVAPQAVVLENVARGGARTLASYVAQGGYLALKKALTLSPDEILRHIETSELRGRGGAAFPTGLKWRAVARETATEKYVIANADEGDPGSYVDRFILEDDPHRVLEAMAIAARAVGASKGIIYLRKEYSEAQIILEQAIADARDDGVLSFDISVFIGQGSYVCGEETALLNSIEGKRPEVRVRPPYPTQKGLFGKPTLVNNVETFATIPWIILHGGAAYRSMGFSKSRGTKVISLNSLFKHPGLYEVEFGISVREIVEGLGGGLAQGQLSGVIIGGPLAGILPPHLLDTPLGFEELNAVGACVGHGGVVAFDERTSIAELVHHIFSFGAYESCGKCTPCRLGSRRIEEVFERPSADRREFERIVAALHETSLCGLGTGLAEFAQSVMRYYHKELDACFT